MGAEAVEEAAQAGGEEEAAGKEAPDQAEPATTEECFFVGNGPLSRRRGCSASITLCLGLPSSRAHACRAVPDGQNPPNPRPALHSISQSSRSFPPRPCLQPPWGRLCLSHAQTTEAGMDQRIGDGGQTGDGNPGRTTISELYPDPICGSPASILIMYWVDISF
ncbi:Os11g0308601 [Oryza sativa Japonica Group]|uniref:Os11g0308601 protein n=3 Tax=Oryza TaxID=4527 RepID=A3CAS6_ORYSJ|nr:hypothetical protein LOC_Os11g20340 [Oryza sativa Japonica Group]EAZ18189.1 hypothetical protein OsJ_33737 [Oryza sativa Japonica Group]BAH95224.1 Os11g0308601 [Oryza sativa Japonica Group]|eukprot:NP_001176496.1 Os11g0308601 [Oryza sativa Japonica Group]